MTYTSSSNGQGDLPIENFVSAATDAIITGKQSVNFWIEKYALNVEEAEQFVSLIKNLSAALMPVKPSKEFTNNLRRDLVGQKDRTLIERIVQLPPRVQIAAFAAVGAGLWILARRRYAALVDEVETESSTEIATAR